MSEPTAGGTFRGAGGVRRQRGRPARLVATCVLTFGATACGGIGDGPVLGPGTPAAAKAAANAPGVTADSISLGVLTDLSGPVLISGTAQSNAARLYFDELNAAGGVCGRTVRLEVRDHHYDVDKAVAAYAELQPRVLGFVQILGASMTSALETNIESDHVLTAPAAWSSTLLTNPYIMIVGTTYDVEAINAVDYLVRTAGVKAGDTIGHVYLDNEYGRNALRGTTFAADQMGATVLKLPISPTATTFTAEVEQLKRARVKAVLLSTLPPQTLGVVRTAAGSGLAVPFVGNSPTFSPKLLQSPAATALQQNFRMVSSFAPFSADVPEVRRIATAYRSAHPKDEPDAMAVFGYAAAEAYANVIARACDAGDLSRNGLVDAFRSTSHVDTKGLMAPLDFSLQGAPGTRKVYVSRPDRAEEGRLGVVETLFASATADRYLTPAQQS